MDWVRSIYLLPFWSAVLIFLWTRVMGGLQHPVWRPNGPLPSFVWQYNYTEICCCHTLPGPRETLTGSPLCSTCYYVRTTMLTVSSLEGVVSGILVGPVRPRRVKTPRSLTSSRVGAGFVSTLVLEACVEVGLGEPEEGTAASTDPGRVLEGVPRVAGTATPPSGVEGQEVVRLDGWGTSQNPKTFFVGGWSAFTLPVVRLRVAGGPEDGPLPSAGPPPVVLRPFGVGLYRGRLSRTVILSNKGHTPFVVCGRPRPFYDPLGPLGLPRRNGPLGALLFTQVFC